jgi:hypothetical protein
MDSTTELTNRLEKLERENRRIKRFGGAALFVLAGLLLVAAAAPGGKPKTIKAGAFEVVDAEGKTRARLGMTKSGGVGLRLLNKTGTRRLQAEMESSGAVGFTCFSAAGRPAVMLMRSSKGIPSLIYANEKGVPLTILNRINNAAYFSMRDENGKNRVGLAARPDHSGVFLNSPDGKLHMAHAVLKDGTPVIKITDKNGKVVWTLPKAEEKAKTPEEK